MQVLPAKRQDENCPLRYSEGSTNQNGKNVVNLCGSKNFEIQVILQLGIQL